MYAIGDKKLIKRINESSILRVIQERGAVSRAEIAKILGLTPATVTNNIHTLMAQGLVCEAGAGDSCGGRKPILLQLNENGVFFIGVDIHRDEVRAAVVNLAGKIVVCDERTFCQDEAFETRVLECICAVRKAFGCDEKLYGIGIGAPGIVDLNSDVSVYLPSIARRNVPLRSYIQENQNLPVYIDNDANAMALGESYFGQAKGVMDYVFLSVGRGIGAGIVLGGKIYRGSRFAAGEIGHIRVQENGRRCVCGKYGCLDTVAAEYNVLRDVSQAIQAGVPSILCEMLDGQLDRLDFASLVAAARAQDKCVLDILRQVGQNLGIAVSYIVNLLNPQMVVLGGNMSVLGEYIRESMVQSATALSMEDCMQGTHIVLSSLRQDAGVVGAASLCIDRLLQKW
ncbi:ROK family protein [uncultured Ruthenibacterium sp.]|uniref:ROK family transcriptional regulator n=1 Tax=uncultured Ruthenibacterium sp. TaxID=1905347 RepID=UPI00349ED0B4